MNNIKKIYLIIMLVFLYAPILLLSFFSFNSGDTMVNFEGFSLQWYQQLFENTDMLVVIIDTIILGLVSALISTIIGTFGAITIYFMKSKRQKDIILSLNSILLVSPDVIIGISFLLLFTFMSFKLGFATVLASHVAFSVPVVVIVVLPRLLQINSNVIDAAYDLGATSTELFKRVLIPQMLPSILAAYFMAFTFSIDDFAVTFFVTGNGFSTLGLEVYSSARNGISLELNALSTIIFVIVLLFSLGYYFLTVKGSNEKTK